VESTASTPENTKWWSLAQSWHENIPDFVLEIKDMKRHWDIPIHVNRMKIRRERIPAALAAHNDDRHLLGWDTLKIHSD
jgi:hypothetical protein